MITPLIWPVVVLSALMVLAALGASTLWIVLVVIGYAIVMIDLTTPHNRST